MAHCLFRADFSVMDNLTATTNSLRIKFGLHDLVAIDGKSFSDEDGQQDHDADWRVISDPPFVARSTEVNTGCDIFQRWLQAASTAVIMVYVLNYRIFPNVND